MVSISQHSTLGKRCFGWPFAMLFGQIPHTDITRRFAYIFNVYYSWSNTIYGRKCQSYNLDCQNGSNISEDRTSYFDLYWLLLTCICMTVIDTVYT